MNKENSVRDPSTAFNNTESKWIKMELGEVYWGLGD